MNKPWLSRFCAMLLAVMLLLSMTVGVSEEAVPDEIDLVSDEIENPVDEIEEFDLLSPEQAVDGEEDISDAIAVSAPETEPKADVDEVAPKSSVPKKAKMVKGVPTELQLGVKETYALSTKKLGKKLSFKSSNEKVAAVDKKGAITAQKTGAATITCYSNKKKVTTCEVTVVPAPKNVTVQPKKLTIGVGEKVALKTTITKGSQATLTWSTRDKKIATVSNDGKITGKKAGNTTVTVKAQNGVKANVTVTVKDAPKKITLNKEKLTLQVGKKATLKATLPKNTAAYNRTWVSSNEKVAIVSDKGVVKAIGPGSAMIMVKTYKKKVKATCKVTVQKKKANLEVDDEDQDDEIKDGYDDWDDTIMDEPEEDPLKVFLYTEESDGIHILEYTGNNAHVIVPSEFEGKKVVSVSLHSSAENGNYDKNYDVVKVTLPNQPIQLGKYAFAFFPNLEKVEGLKNVTLVDSYAFETTAIREVVFSKNLKTLGINALNAGVIQSVTIPSDINYTISSFIGWYIEKYKLIDGEGEPTVKLIDGVLYSADGRTLLFYPPLRKGASYTILDGTEKIAESAMASCKYLLELTIPKSVREIAESAFIGIPVAVCVYKQSYAHQYISELAKKTEIDCIIMDQMADEGSILQIIKNVVNENTSADMSDYEKALSLHDWLIAYAEYSYDYNSPVQLLKYGKGVCHAYAYAYSMLLDEAGIENKPVGNADHEFVAVKISGDWMYVDCTWDDQGEDEWVNHRYFGFEDTMRYAIYGADSPDTYDDIIVSRDDISSTNPRNHYWYRKGYCESLIKKTASVIQHKLSDGKTTCKIAVKQEIGEDSFVDDTIAYLLTSSEMSMRRWKIEGIACKIYCTWSDGIMYCAVKNSDQDLSDYEYDIKDNKIRILKYKGTDEKVIIPNRINGIQVSTIGQAAFMGNCYVKSVSLPNSIIEIEGNAFRGAAHLKKINFPKYLKTIGDKAFGFCTALVSDVVLPEGFDQLGFAAFENCTAITKVKLPSTVKLSDLVFLDCSGLKTLILSEGIEYIGPSDFSGCKNLTAIKLPSTITTIEVNAFAFTGITEIVIPKSVSRIGDAPVQNCKNLNSLTVESGNKYFKSEGNIVYTADGKEIVFSAQNAGTENYTIPSGVETIRNRAFIGNQVIKNLTIPGTVHSIGEYAFYEANIHSLVIQNGCISIGELCFRDCHQLVNVDLANSINRIGGCAFCGSVIEELHIPEGITKIPDCLFSVVKKLYIPKTVKSAVPYPYSSESTVYGYKGTFAETFAKNHGMKFVAIG